MDFRKVNNGIDLFTSELYQTNTFVMDLGDRVIISDPSWLPSEIEEIRTYVTQLASGRQICLYITHYDYDHVWGAGAFPDAYVIAPSLDGLESVGQKCLKQWAIWDSEHYIIRPYDIVLPSVQYLLNTNSVLTLGDHMLHFYHAPGHTPDGYFCVIDPEGVLLLGDYLCDVEIPWVGQSISSYRQTLIQLIELIHYHKIRIAIPGHGTIMQTKEEMISRIDAGLYYLDLLENLDDEKEKVIMDLINQYPFPAASVEIHKQNLKHIEVNKN